MENTVPTMKALLSPGGLSSFGDSRGGDIKVRGLSTEGDLFTKSNDKDVKDSFLILPSHMLRDHHHHHH